MPRSAKLPAVGLVLEPSTVDPSVRRWQNPNVGGVADPAGAPAPETVKESNEIKTQKLIAAIEEGVQSLVTSDDWKSWLDMQAKFHRYSFANVMLLTMQNPDVSNVASFKKWQELGRCVTKGETAMRVLAPIIKKVELKDKPGEYKEQCVGFRGVPVFDISQTEGPDLPQTVKPLQGDVPEGMIDSLHDHAKDLNATVLFAHPGDDPYLDNRPNVNGYVERLKEGGHRIVVRGTLSPAQQAKTYAHEIGHLAMGHQDEENPNSKNLRSDKEVEAESFAYLISASWGLDTGDYSFGYTAGWSGGDSKRVRASAEIVSKTARKYMNKQEAVSNGTDLRNAA
jgi:N-terminal domain of anti-restriction factor ArdC/IrrE N-terminal-like domain